ncbi:SIP domain-containing protein [Rhizobium paknamense]|uniref:NADPH-dependent ferric siderophore reductase/DNA-binding PadR family transcriptional regulator n=1 Tax=Rhizobium paknamense TaxID=1206817 RepID=A0ABU0IBW0_9HYPH|nr:SIP domain-containing protein [Rhizobium paknamense]MDQ0455715.1 NADPH-dependent ferric siderophore reductase/DNA-binding PadR family transcriptional regulator [Rhizobium paknamense]
MILALIAERPSHGYELIQAVSACFGGGYSPSPGVLYPTLAWLRDQGFARPVVGEGARKSYAITPEGEAFLSANHATVHCLRAKGRKLGGRHNAPPPIIQAMDEVKAALRSSVRGPDVTPQEIEQIAAILREAARQISTNRIKHEMKTETSVAETVATLEPPRIERVRHELRRRQLTVLSTERLTPNMIRLALGGEELQGFVSASPDDHIKIFVPDATGEMVMREYTPRRYEPETGRLLLDFAVHDAGPATEWAVQARPGDKIQIGGPRGSAVIAGPVPAWLLVGDETALPAIGRRLEELPPGTPVTTVIAVPGPADEQSFETKATLTAQWLHRSDPTDAAPFLAALKNLPLQPGTFVWIAAEGAVTKAIRAHFLEERQHPRPWLKAAGYWVKGKADTKESFED